MNNLDKFISDIKNKNDQGVVIPAVLWFLGVPGVIVLLLWVFGVI